MRILMAIGLCLVGTVVRAQECPGDLDGNGNVTVAELVTAVNSALDGCAASCPADQNGDGEVTISELVSGVRSALEGCPASATQTANAEGSRTPTPSPTATPTSSTPAPTATLTIGEQRAKLEILRGQWRFTSTLDPLVTGQYEFDQIDEVDGAVYVNGRNVTSDRYVIAFVSDESDVAEFFALQYEDAECIAFAFELVTPTQIRGYVAHTPLLSDNSCGDQFSTIRAFSGLKQ